MSSPADRFELKVDRTGPHHRWTGSHDAEGRGQIRVNGRLTTAPRVAWELANGPIPDGATIIGCQDDKACVRVDHLALRSGPAGSTPEPQARRARPGSGTMRQVRPGTWKLTVDLGPDATGRRRRTNRTVAATGPAEASKALTAFAHEKRSTLVPTASSNDPPPGVTTDGLIEAFLIAHLLQQRRHDHPTDNDHQQQHP